MSSVQSSGPDRFYRIRNIEKTDLTWKKDTTLYFFLNKFADLIFFLYILTLF